jgi:beta-glucanase (GH16 family)
MSQVLPRLAGLGLVLLASGSDCGGEPFEWELSWQDEFEGPAGELPDATRWTFDVGTDWGNQQLEYDTDQAANVSLDGEGHLAITAREEFYQGQPYTSGRITTQGLFAQALGRFEARIKLPYGQGIWPAFWLLGNDFPTVGWPTCGEIDILEYRGQESNRILGSVHGPGYSGGASITQTYDRPGRGFYRDFHVFGIEWDADRITWTVDDVEYHSVTASSVRARGPWVFDHPFFMILNVAVGGTFVDSPDSTTSFPQTMLVDWVRVYRGKS